MEAIVIEKIDKTEEHIGEIYIAYSEALEQGEQLDLSQFELTEEQVEVIKAGGMLEAVFRRLRQDDPELCDM